MDHKPSLLTIKEILNILPHRYPFLLVDKVVEIDLEKDKIVGHKNVTMNEPFFQGHFPNVPLMPGVLILEALAQVGGILIHQKGFNDKIAVFLNITQAKFRNPVRPGDILILQAEGLHFSTRAGKMKTIAMVDGKVAAEAEMAFALVDKSQI
jgi:3-hydroxyacyl-[acyl-carrier-protein] dehydratase